MGLRLVDLLTQFETEPRAYPNLLLCISFFLKKRNKI